MKESMFIFFMFLNFSAFAQINIHKDSIPRYDYFDSKNHSIKRVSPIQITEPQDNCIIIINDKIFRSAMPELYNFKLNELILIKEIYDSTSQSGFTKILIYQSRKK